MNNRIFSYFLFLFMVSSSWAQTTYQYTPTVENIQAREDFKDAKFGVFIHWGVYSMLATGEWTMTNNNLNYKEYEKLAGGFYPAEFSAQEWVSTVKKAGAKYICITTRHHDGFSLFDSKYTDYTLTKASPFGRDVIKELAEECQKQDIRLHLYYSHIDWGREDAPWGRTGRGTGRPNPEGDWKSYYSFMNNQITELLTNYGPIGAIWFDGWWDQDQNPDFDWELPYQYDLIHRLQPACLIGNNHHQVPFEGEDIQIFERDLPGENQAGLSGQKIIDLPLETCETMNGMWGYKITDQNYKSTKTLIHYLVKAAGRNGNLLLNVGPQPDGQFPLESVRRLEEIGEWLRVYGETIYGTRAGIISPRDWGVTTQKGNKIYVHILNLADQALFLPLQAKDVHSAYRFGTHEKIEITKGRLGITLNLSEIPTDIDYIVELTLKE